MPEVGQDQPAVDGAVDLGDVVVEALDAVDDDVGPPGIAPEVFADQQSVLDHPDADVEHRLRREPLDDLDDRGHVVDVAGGHARRSAVVA